MQTRGPLKQGVVAYAGLSLSHFNNSDVASVYSVKYEASIRDGASSSSYQQFSSVIGQFLRLAIVAGHTQLHTVCDPGETFKLFCSQDLLQAFLNYFNIRSSAATVMVKCMHLKVMLSFAGEHFASQDDNSRSSLCRTAREFVNGIFKAKKKLSRRLASAARNMDERVSKCAMIFPKDFQRFLKESADALRGIISSTMDEVMYFQSNGYPRSVSFSKAAHNISENKTLLCKWCINIVALLVLSAGGQRPQVFCQLIMPTVHHLFENKAKYEESSFIDFATGFEKTVRNTNMPHVMIPATYFDIVLFQARVNAVAAQKLRAENISIPSCNDSCEGIVSKDNEEAFNEVDCTKTEKKSCGVKQNNTQISSEDLEGEICNMGTSKSGKRRILEPFIFHSANGSALKPAQVTSTLKIFLKKCDPELGSITTMNVRESYASMMFKGRKNGKIFSDASEQTFLEFMASQMNTSVEQLRTTYLAIDKDDFTRDGRAVVNAFAGLIQSEEDDSLD